MSSFLNAFVLLFYVVENLFCGEAGCHLPERRRLHFQVLLRGGGRVERGAASPLRRLRRGAEQRVEIDSPFQGGSTGHGAGMWGGLGSGVKGRGSPSAFLLREQASAPFPPSERASDRPAFSFCKTVAVLSPARLNPISSKEREQRRSPW